MEQGASSATFIRSCKEGDGLLSPGAGWIMFQIVVLLCKC